MTSHAINAVERAVEETYTELLRMKPGLCACERCRDDIITLALNHARPRYMAGTKLGGALTRVELATEQARVELTVIVLDAIKQVSQRPRHDRT